MENRITPNGLELICESRPGPITLQVFFPSEYQSQNQKLLTKNSQKLFLQLKDEKNKGLGYLCEKAYKDLFQDLADHDLIEIGKYELQEVSPEQKIIKITRAELIQRNEQGDGIGKASLDKSRGESGIETMLKPQTQTQDKIPTSTPSPTISSKMTPVYKNGQNRKNTEGVGGFLDVPQPEQINLTPSKNSYIERGGSPSGYTSSTRKQNEKVAKSLFTTPETKSPSSKSDMTPGRTLYSPMNNSNRKKFLDSEDIYTPINQLAVGDETWIIKARIVQKGEKITFSRKNSTDSSLFNITLLDKDNSEISAVFFDSAVVEKYYEVVEKGKIFAINGGQIKNNTKKYGKSRNNLQIVFDARHQPSFVEQKEDTRIPKGLYLFAALNELSSKHDGDSVDIVGIVVKTNPVETINMNDGRTASVRKLEIMDDSMQTVEVAFWGYKAAVKVEVYDMVMITPAKIKIFANVKTLTVPNFAEVYINDLPTIPYIVKLQEWSNQLSKKEVTRSVQYSHIEEHTKTLREFEENAVTENQTIWVNAQIAYIYDEKIVSETCPHCKKTIEFDRNQATPKKDTPGRKGNQAAKGTQCNKCGQTYYSTVKRLMIKTKLVDFTGSLVALAYGQAAEELIRKTTDEMFDVNSQDRKEILRNPLYNDYKIQIKYLGILGDYKRFVIQKIQPMDYQEAAFDVLSKLEAYKSTVPTVINGIYDLF